MKIWTIIPSGEGTVSDIPTKEALQRAEKIIGAPICLTYVLWNDKRCHMAVDDEASSKGLPFNQAATHAYLQACRSGTEYEIYGTAVIFDTVLP